MNKTQLTASATSGQGNEPWLAMAADLTRLSSTVMPVTVGRHGTCEGAWSKYVDAQSMFVAIKARFGGNDATKKTQKALLKQQYENFNATSSESLDSIFNRLQKLVIWMNKPDFDTMGLDDLYNNFKIVEQKVKRTAAANNDDKNLAFLTTSSPSHY
ncbi:hypothetical protein Tco_1107657 [Tanacetum coccineum]